MKDFDLKIKDILARDEELPNSYKNMVRTALFKENKIKDKKIQFKTIPAVTIGIIFLTGICFAASYTVHQFFNHNKGMDKAIENGYIYNNETEYITTEDIGIKVEKILMDDYNLNILFSIEYKEKLNELNNIEFSDMIITDNDNKIIYCENEETFNKYCSLNNVDAKWKENNSNYINSGSNFYMKNKGENNLLLVYNFYSDMFPRSKKLNIEIHTIKLYYEKEEIRTGNWKLEVEIPEMFYNRENYVYQVDKCTKKDFDVKKIIVYNTGTKLELVTEEKPELPFDINDDEETKNRKIKEFQEKVKNMTVEEYEKQIENSKFKNEYIENADGIRFYPSKSTDSDGGYSNTEMKYLNYWQTFDMTKYDATDKIKIYLNYKGEDVWIYANRK